MSAVLTIRFQVNGYDLSLALDGDNGLTLLNKINDVIKRLRAMEAKPTGAAAPPLPNPAGILPEIKICPLHQVMMKQRTGQNGDTWYSHKAIDPETRKEYWCRGKGKGGRS